MKRKHKYFEVEDLEPKQFSCFVCTEKSKEKGISLLQSQTAFSRISLGEKLQEILGTKYVVLVTSRDLICWDCASYINWVDRCEHKVDLVKEYIVNQVSSKYRKIEVGLHEKVECLEHVQETVINQKPATPPLPAVVPQLNETRELKEDPPPKSRRKKEYSCKYCGKGYVSLMSLSMHIQRLHGGKEVCDECGARYETLAQLKRHMKSHLPADKQLTCVSCGFHTTNTEVYCRHVCNSSIVSLTCISCNKRYVDSHFKQESSSGTYQCQSCLTDEAAKLQQEEHPQEENPGAELATEMPEFFKDPLSNNDDIKVGRNEEECVSYLRCEGCEEQFKLGDLTKHLCFIRGETVEFVEVEAPSFQGKKTQPTCVPLFCKDCGDQFMNIEALRNHWELSGHIRQVSTTDVELNKIRDKYKKTEATFKVVKQNFNIRAIIPGQNEEALRSADDYKDMFVKVSSTTDAIEDFVRKDGKECGTCGIVFATNELLEEHQRLDCLTCVTCSVSFYDNKLLKRHYLYTGHANKVIQTPQYQTSDSRGPMGFRCHRCVKTFQSRFLLKKHFQVHYRGTEKGACQFCLLEFENKNDIQQHVLEAHGAHLYKCSHCERTFMSETFRNRHEAKHKGPFECQVCDVKFVSKKYLLLHNETYHQGESGSCTLCSKIFEDPVALRKHERRHYFEKELACDVCKKRFRNKSLLIAHLKVHGDKIKAKCDVCHLGFATEEALKDHKFSHMKPGRYKCPRCNATFANKANFWMHTKTHEACYVCTVCNRSFRDTSLLAVHRRKHWRVRPYQCPHCPQIFSVPATLRRHLHVHTRIYPHKCGLCKKGFLTRHAYHRHTETVHGVSNSFPQRRPNIPSLPLNATDEDIFQAADTLIADDSLMFNDYQNKDIEQVSTTDLITNEVVVETTELFDEILH